MISGMRNWGQEFGLINLTRLKQSDHVFNARLRDGTLHKLTAEVAMDSAAYRDLAPWDRAAARAFAVGMTMDKAVVGGQAAARLWSLDTLEVEKYVACYLPGGGTPSSPRTWPKGVLYRYGRLDPGDIREHHGIRVVSLMRLLLDIAHYDGLHATVVVIDSARRTYPELTQGELRTRLDGYRRYRGMRVLRQAIDLSISNSDSAQETRARLILHEAKLPEITSIQPQVRFDRDRSGRFYLVDFLINGWIIVEIDGRSKYKTNTLDKLDSLLLAERDREKFFTNHGYIVLRIEPKQLDAAHGEECEFIRILRRVLEQGPPAHLRQVA